MEIEVKGHSGCNVEVAREYNQLFIYKSTTDPNYFRRLQLQGEKQLQAKNHSIDHIRIPEIYSITCNDITTSIKMQYVYSKNFVEYFEHAGFEQIELFTQVMISFVENEIEQSCIKALSASVLSSKFEDVKRKITQNLVHRKDIADLVTMTEMHFTSLPEMYIPIGVCHGDLTFSNILFNGNDCYLIDFLDSFVETPLMDIVKLRQDSAYMWSRMMYKQALDATRLEIISHFIDKRIDSHFRSKYEWYTQYYTIFQLMNMLRILQYAKDEHVINNLKNNIEGLLYEL